MDPYGPAKSWLIPRIAVTTMIESFNNGNKFVITSDVLNGPSTSQQFNGRHAHNFDIDGKLNHVFKVTNDERRRLLPILKDLHLRVHYDNSRNPLLSLLSTEYLRRIYGNTLKEESNKCPNCNSGFTSYAEIQKRSCDEPMTKMFTCGNCNHKWTI